jgi:hypothetical protein
MPKSPPRTDAHMPPPVRHRSAQARCCRRSPVLATSPQHLAHYLHRSATARSCALPPRGARVMALPLGSSVLEDGEWPPVDSHAGGFRAPWGRAPRAAEMRLIRWGHHPSGGVRVGRVGTPTGPDAGRYLDTAGRSHWSYSCCWGVGVAGFEEGYDTGPRGLAAPPPRAPSARNRSLHRGSFLRWGQDAPSSGCATTATTRARHALESRVRCHRLSTSSARGEGVPTTDGARRARG